MKLILAHGEDYEKELKRWLQTMHSYGIAIIQNAPTNDKSGFKILDKIGKYRETFFR